MIKEEEINIYFYGDKNFKLNINVLKAWRISEESLMIRYEPIFNSYLSYVAGNADRNFIKFLKQLPPEVLNLKSLNFEIFVDDGILEGDSKIELDCMINIDEAIIAIKNNLFWVVDQKEPERRYFFSL